MGGGKKEYLPFESNTYPGATVLSAALFAFLATKQFSYVIVTLPPGEEERAREMLGKDGRIQTALANTVLGDTTLAFTEGGASRQQSVLHGMEKLAEISGQRGKTPDTVLIHDAARPWVSEKTILSVLRDTIEKKAAVAAVPAVDTQKIVDPSGRIVTHLDRSSIAAVQTPQGFIFSPLLEAHRKAASDGRTYTDDTEIWSRYAGDVFISEGDPSNRKITYPGDIA